MLQIATKYFRSSIKNSLNFCTKHKPPSHIPNDADVVIIGGGSAGCYTLYHLAKRGIRAVLLEKFKLTSGTTWHTNGLMWRIRPSETDIELLNRTRDTVIDIKENTEFDPGWIQNGGIFIARSKTRMDEYQRLATIAKVYNIEQSMLTTDETMQLFPLLNRDAFIGSLYSPGDGIIDPTMLCNALTKLAIQTKNAQIIEQCSVSKILTEQTEKGVHKIVGLQTDHGEIRTKCVVNATGVWGRDLIEPFGISIPLIPMKHSYVVSESIEGARYLPNLRDHDASIAVRVQGTSMYLGGYEKNPIILDKVDADFSFSLYDLDWSTFDKHIDQAVELIPAFGTAGVKCTICGPESFTPDHKPIMGPDPRLIGLFHNCGFNSAGMMLGGGCGEQIAEWIIHDRPEFYMHHFDIRRFTAQQMACREYAIERCHEAYAENYSIVFAFNQPLAGRNFKKDPLHDELMKNGAVMEEKQGHERPAFFYEEKAPINIPSYDWYGAYDHAINTDTTYLSILKADQTYDFSKHHDRIGKEAMRCRTGAAVFNLSSFCKILIEGPDATEALQWICTNDTDKPVDSIIYTCALNARGGVEAHFNVVIVESSDGSVTKSKSNQKSYYIFMDGSTGNHTLAHINESVAERKFNVLVQDVSDQTGIISIQGPNGRSIMEEMFEMQLGSEKLPLNSSTVATFKDAQFKAAAVRVMHYNSTGAPGYELHMDQEDCLSIYKRLMEVGIKYGLKNAGFRAYNSLNLEIGHHMWGYDLRSDDSPIEANLEFVCRTNGNYKGSSAVEKQRKNGTNKQLIYLTLDARVPLWGLEGVYRNGEAVGYLRRGDFGYSINKSIGNSYICRKDGQSIDGEYLTKGNYEIDVLGELYPAKILKV